MGRTPRCTIAAPILPSLLSDPSVATTMPLRVYAAPADPSSASREEGHVRSRGTTPSAVRRMELARRFNIGNWSASPSTLFPMEGDHLRENCSISNHVDPASAVVTCWLSCVVKGTFPSMASRRPHSKRECKAWSSPLLLLSC